MPRLSIARLLVLALVGLTVALAAVAALEVAALYGARQDYEDAMARSYAGQVAAADALAASAVGSRAPARRALRRSLRAARRAAAGDPRSLRLLRRAGGRLDTAGGRTALVAFDRRQARRRAAARDEASAATRRAVIAAAVAGFFALLGALALVSVLVGRLRDPLARLVDATNRLAAGDADARVDPAGPDELRRLGTSFNAMADDLERGRARVEESRRRLATVIERLGDALVICDGYGRVVEVNPRAAELVPSLTPGTSVRTDPGPLPPLEEALAREVEVEGSERVLSVTAARLGDDVEDGVVFTVRDVTERVTLDRARSELIATASHELRSPLTSIKGFAELLAQSGLADRQRGFVDTILLSTNRLVELVEDLLDTARMEAGRLEIERQPMAVGAAAREVADLMAPQFAEREQTLEVEIAPDLPQALGDPGRVRQIVTNLLTNAHSYSGAGGRVLLRVEATGADVVLAVSDRGRGAGDEGAVRADGSRGAGTGLGLSVVRSLVALHEGSIDVSSREGEGTTVTVRLPRVSPAAEPAVPARSA